MSIYQIDLKLNLYKPDEASSWKNSSLVQCG